MRKFVDTHQLVMLFFGNLTILFIGMGLFPVLPHYVSRLGASPGMVGVFFATIYAALTAGNLLAGGLSAIINRRKLFIAAGLAALPALFGLGKTSDFWQALVLTSIVWFCGGIDLALINVFTGQHTTRRNRGKSFSLISLSIPLGSLIGASTVAYLSVNFGYTTMFASLGIIWMVLPILGLVAIKDRPIVQPASRERSERSSRSAGNPFRLLIMAAILSATVINMERLGLSLSMKSMNFSAQAIAGTATISGLFALPVMIFVGSITDRLGNRLTLGLVYLVAASSAVLLSQANMLWQFTVAAILMLVAFCLNGAMTSALAAELIPRKTLDGKLAWINTAISSGAILSFLSTGYTLEVFGANNLFLAASALPFVAAGVLQVAITKSAPREERLTLPEGDCFSNAGKEPV